MKSRCSRLLLVCAALLCVLLLTVTIVQSMKLSNMKQEREQQQISYANMTAERDGLRMLNHSLQWRLRYFIITQNKIWSEARAECISRGADLVIIDRQEEQEHIAKLLIGEAWIGLSDSAEEGTWMWVDGTHVTAGYWWEGEPNDYDQMEDCAVTGSKFAKDGLATWADYTCDTALPAICEKNASNS